MSVLEWMYRDSDDSTRLDRKYETYKLFQTLRHIYSETERRQKYKEIVNSEAWQHETKCKQQHKCPKINKIPHA